MYVYGTFLLLTATIPVLTSVRKNDDHICRELMIDEKPVLDRTKRQANRCRRDQWQCHDGSCIGFDGKCDGIVDCRDGSDETHPLCRNNKCQSNWFRCTYGACVDGTAPCNGIQECADNSDELLPRCRNATIEVNGQFKCDNGEMIPASSHCDGIADCSDGSDENIKACAGKTCYSYLFQCAYGACVDSGADCNGKQECADGSDESDELCNRSGGGTGQGSGVTPQPKPNSGKCTLPPYPAHGRYTVMNAPNASPGQTGDLYVLNVTCYQGYGAMGDTQVFCAEGTWTPETLPECIRFCKLNRHPSVEHSCRFTIGGVESSRPCNNYEPPGTVAWPECVKPSYFFLGELPTMRCGQDGSWDNNPTCTPDCGQVTPEGAELIIGGRRARRGELPWHVGIYKKTTTPYMQICGGSLVRPSVVISAAHCFWNDESKAQPAKNYAVAVGKLYRPWDDPNDDSQKADVTSIYIPTRFRGSASNFMEDLAVLLLSVSFVYKPHIAPVCLDFDENFDHLQLAEGTIGKVAGWGLTDVNGPASQVLKVVELPFVTYDVCFNESPPNFRAYITGDKICAGYRNNGTAVCKGDSGGGFVIAQYERGKYRYYLRGVVSTAPNDENLCNANTITTFTHLIKHAPFIKNYL
ncbi:modular serine protease isoform X3 [Plodia interpunctella]|uniref:modular serine protease isoform X3 n=1 Tax=Plodia interpunctella TaxID=58824 RepID=UPI002367E10E|nr:modular serine protease isoform X2 [Plodia interpunctella]